MGAFKLNRAGVAAILKSAEMAAMVDGAARKIAADAEATSGLPVEVTAYTTDRAGAAVTITDPQALASQAKHGTLTRAAGAIGVEVTAR